MGPLLCKGLRKVYGERIGCQGISTSDGYSATITDNMRQKGTADESITAGVNMFTLAHTKCPASILVFTGYRSVRRRLARSSLLILH
jgi:hypothetical protein